MKPTLSEAMKARLADLCGDDRVKTALQVCVDEADRAMEEQIHISEIESPTFAEGVRGEEIARLLKSHPTIGTVVLNGSKSAVVWRRHAQREALLERPDLRVLALPSTSPANARLRLADLEMTWREALAVG